MSRIDLLIRRVHVKLLRALCFRRKYNEFSKHSNTQVPYILQMISKTLQHKKRIGNITQAKESPNH